MQPEHNFNKAASYIRSAASQGAELAVLPEYHLANWKPEDPAFIGVCEQWEMWLSRYKELAKECGICIVPGTIVEARGDEEKKEGEEGEQSGDGERERQARRLQNVAYFIDFNGEVVGKYVKKNLWYDGFTLFCHSIFCMTFIYVLLISTQVPRTRTLDIVGTRSP